ncbi:hypothetical protein BC826DRAFT_125834 [Russula brevipes]|nr:hypothetical protein BC826DRAFT_125834 [Russula brevipes]
MTNLLPGQFFFSLSASPSTSPKRKNAKLRCLQILVNWGYVGPRWFGSSLLPTRHVYRLRCFLGASAIFYQLRFHLSNPQSQRRYQPVVRLQRSSFIATRCGTGNPGDVGRRLTSANLWAHFYSYTAYNSRATFRCPYGAREEDRPSRASYAHAAAARIREDHMFMPHFQQAKAS